MKKFAALTLSLFAAIPGCGAVGQQPCAGGGIQPPYPALTTTTISTSGIGGYGSPYANNTGCGTETLPTGTSAPGTGGTCAGDIRMITEATLGFWHKMYQGEKVVCSGVFNTPTCTSSDGPATIRPQLQRSLLAFRQRQTTT